MGASVKIGLEEHDVMKLTLVYIGHPVALENDGSHRRDENPKM